MPTISTIPFEAHPFTIANMPDQGTEDGKTGDVVLIIRARDGFTKRLLDKAESGVRIPSFIEGPYGHSSHLNHYEQVLLVCGGSGISFGTSNLINIIHAARLGTSAVRRVKLVWMIRDKSHWEWIRTMINPLLVDLPESLIVEINVHITTKHAVEPNLTAEEAALEDSTPEALYEHQTGGESGSSSQTQVVLDNKVEKEKNQVNADPEAAYISWAAGRADLYTILDNMVSVANSRVSVNGKCIHGAPLSWHLVGVSLC